MGNVRRRSGHGRTGSCGPPRDLRASGPFSVHAQPDRRGVAGRRAPSRPRAPRWPPSLPRQRHGRIAFPGAAANAIAALPDGGAVLAGSSGGVRGDAAGCRRRGRSCVRGARARARGRRDVTAGRAGAAGPRRRDPRRRGRERRRRGRRAGAFSVVLAHRKDGDAGYELGDGGIARPAMNALLRHGRAGGDRRRWLRRTSPAARARYGRDYQPVVAKLTPAGSPDAPVRRRCRHAARRPAPRRAEAGTPRSDPPDRSSS